MCLTRVFLNAVAAIAALGLTPVVAQDGGVFLSRSLSQVGQTDRASSAEIGQPATRADVRRMLSDAGMLATETASGFQFQDRRQGLQQVRSFEVVLEGGSMRVIHPLEGALNARSLTRAQMNALMQANTQIAPFSFAVDPAAQRLQLEYRLPAVMMQRADLLQVLDSAALAADRTAPIWRVTGPNPQSPQTGRQSANQAVPSQTQAQTQAGNNASRPQQGPTNAAASSAATGTQPANQPWWQAGRTSGQRSIMVRERPAQTLRLSNAR